MDGEVRIILRRARKARLEEEVGTGDDLTTWSLLVLCVYGATGAVKICGERYVQI